MTTLPRTALSGTRTGPATLSPLALEALEGRALLASDLGLGANLLFVTDNVANSHALTKSFPGTEVVHLDSRLDVMDQISSALAGRSGLASIQFLSHGSSGRLNLGSFGGQGLDAHSLDQYAGAVASWGKALADDGDILLWGCDVGQGDAGAVFVNNLARMTGADVGASSNRTGSSRQGGDWTLEIKTGRIEANAGFIAPRTYAYTLAAPSISGAVAAQAVNENATIRPFDAVVVASDNPATSLAVSVTLDNAAKGVFTSASLASSGFASMGGGVYTFTGTAAQATTALARLVFDPADNRVDTGSTETTTFTISADNGVNPATTNNTTTVVSTAVNDSPIVSGTASGQTVADTGTVSPFSAVTIGDADSPAQSLTIMVSLDIAAKGVFTSASLTASGFDDEGNGIYSFTGTAAQATTAIRALVFDPANNRVAVGASETTTFTISVNDGVAAELCDSTTTVVSTSQNDAPTFGGASAGQAVDDDSTVTPFSGFTITDVDPTQQVAVAVTLDTAAKGVFTAGSLATSGFAHQGGGVYTFTGTGAQATTAIRQLVFAPTPNRVAVGATETTTFTVTANDGIAAVASNNTTTVVSTSVNDAPTITGAVAAQAVNDSATVSPFTGVTIADADATQSLTVTVTLDAAAKGVFTSASLTASGFSDEGGGVYSFTGTAAQATTAIRALVFDPANNRVAVGATETTTFTISADDGEAAAATNNTTTVVSTSVNDAPTISGAVAGQAVNDNATVSPFSGVTLADVDPGHALTVTVTLDSAAKGVFTSASLTASGFNDDGGGVYSFSGTAAQATTAIQALVFDPADNRVAVGATETTTFTISVSDGVAAPTTNNTTTAVSTSVNDAPSITGASADQAVNDDATVSPFSGVTIADVDAGHSLTVSITLDTSAKGVFTSASLTASGFVDSGSGVYTFTGTAAQATTAIRALVFDPANDRVAVGVTETTTFTISADDGIAAPVTDDTTTVVSTSMNDAPTISGASAGHAVNDNATTTPFAQVSITDMDPTESVTITITLDNAAKGVFTPASLAASGFNDDGDGVYSFSGFVAQATGAIQALVFDPANNRVAVGSTETTTFTIEVDDGVAAPATNSTTTVVSTSVNDAPTIGGASAGQAVNDNATVSPFSAVTIGDVDPGQSLTVTVTLDAAAKGVFTSASLTASGFIDSGAGVYTFTGSAAAATTAIQALVFDPTDNRVAVASTETTTFTISVNDSVAAAVTNNTTTVVSTSVNDAPTITGAVAGQAVNDNATVSLFSGVTFADVDPGHSLTITVTLDTAAKGVFTSASLTASGFNDEGGGEYSFTGTASQATTAIRALVFDPANNRVAVGLTETTTFTISADDGIAAAATSNTTTVVSTSVNDLSTITGAVASQAVNDNATVSPFSGVTIADVDSPAQTLTVEVSLDTPAKGVFTAGSLAASGFVDEGEGIYSFTGTAAQATTAIRALVFQPTNDRVNPGQTETTFFAILVDDGFSGVANTTTSVISTPVNDAPSITGAVAAQAVNDNANLSPFSGVTIGDADSSQSLIVTVTLDTAAKGVFTSASLTASGFIDSGAGVYTFTGTASAATTAIRALVFDAANNRVAPGATETTTFTISANDGVAAATTDNTTTVVSTSVNDAPTISGAVAAQATTDTANISPFSALTIADPDFPAQSLTVSVTLDAAAKGVFTSASLTASGFTDAGDGLYTFTGSAAQATTAIQALVFDPADNRVAINSSETSTFTISVDDGIAAAVTNNTTTVVSTNVNDAPTTTGTAAGQAVTDITTVSPFTGVTIADVDPGQTMTVTVTLDTAAKGVFTPGSLTASGFQSSGAGVYTFTGSAEAATTAIRALVFDPTNNRVNPGQTETTTFTIGVTDGISAVVTNNATTVVSTSVNDAPTVSGEVADQAVNDTANVSPFTAVTIGDADGSQSLTVSVTLDDAAKGVFTAASLTASGFVSQGAGVYTFTGNAAAATTAIRALVFDAANNRVAVGATETTTFTISVDDGIDAVATGNTTTVVSTSINDAPTIAGAVAGQAVSESATISPFAAITITDNDFAQDVSVSVTLDNAAKGVFTAESLTASSFVSQGGGVYTFTGSGADATTAIRALVFDPANNRVAVNAIETTTFTISVNDGVAAAAANSTTTVRSTNTNDAPTVTTLTATPDPILRRNNITLTATGVADVDNTARYVEFYRDVNGNGTIEVGIDKLLGTVAVVGGSASKTVATTGFATGDNTFLARAKDNLNLVGAAVTTTAGVTNRAPTLTAISRSPQPVAIIGANLTLTASGVSDLDGTVASVEFYLDDGDGIFNADDDTLLGTDASASGGYRVIVATTGFTAGEKTYFARVIDNDGDASAAVSVTGRINAAPTFTTITSNLPAVNRRGIIQLSVSGAADTDGTVNRVEFYRDMNGNGTFEAGIDTLVGADTTATAGAYTINVNTTGFTAGDNTFFARVRDNNGGYSDADSVEVTINNLAPSIASLTRSLALVPVLGNNVTLTARTVSDLDGTITGVEFYRDNGDGIFNIADDTLLGTDAAAAGGYTLITSTAGFDVGTNMLFARAVDNNGGTSSVVSTTLTVNAAPTITGVTVNPNPISRAATYTLSATSPADSDGTIRRVEFFRDRGQVGVFEAGADQLLGYGVLSGGNYTLTLNGSSLAIGTHTFFARVLDNNGAYSAVVSITVNVVA